MATQRNRPVLFELVKQGKSSNAKTWRAPPPAKVQAAQQRAAQPDAPPPQPATQPVRTGAAPAGWSIPMPGFAGEIAGDEIRVSVNFTMAAIVAAALLALLVVAFQIGRWTAKPAGPTSDNPAGTSTTSTAPPNGAPSRLGGGPNGGSTQGGGDSRLNGPAQPDKIHTPGKAGPDGSGDTKKPTEPPAREGDREPQRDKDKPAPPPVEPKPTPPVEPKPEPAAPSVELKKGYHYLVIQHFRKNDTEQAESAARYLIAAGVPCAVQAMKADIRVIATEPFLINQKDPGRKTEQSRANDLIQKVKKLGKEYSRTSGYAFDQCELKELK